MCKMLRFPIFNHHLKFSLSHDITLDELKEICIELNGRPLNRSEMGIALPSSKYTSKLIQHHDIQTMINDEPYVKRFFEDKYMNGIRSIRFSISPFSSSVYWQFDNWISQCKECPDLIFIEKGKGELLFIIDSVKTFEPEGLSEKEYITIKTVLASHGFEFEASHKP